MTKKQKAEAWFNSEINALKVAAFRRNACVVLCNTQPVYTAFTHGEAYRVSAGLRKAGHRSMYKPLH